MDSYFKRVNNRVNKWVKKDEILSIVTRKIKEKYVNVSISSETLLRLVSKQNSKDLSNLDVVISDKSIIISGVAKKFFLKFPFSVSLTPTRSEGRKVFFFIEKMSPLDQSWIKRLIFNKQKAITYIEEHVCINLNDIEKIKVIPLGTIRRIEVKENKLYVSVGL